MAGLALAVLADREATGEESGEAPIVFVCQNGVAMSVWSAMTFDRLAAERGLRVRALSRAAMPTFTSVPLRMRLALWFEGLRVGDYRPRVVEAADVRRAARVIAIDTELPRAAVTPGAVVETWDGFPPMREQYFASRAALRRRVQALVEQLAASRGE